MRINKPIYTKPIYAEASGNTFLIFDYLDKCEHSFEDVDIIRHYHKSYGFEKIDSCLVLTRIKEVDEEPVSKILRMRMFVYEPGDGFCGNGARVVSKYCFNRHKNSHDQFFIESDDWSHELIQRDTEYLVEMGKSIYHDPSGDFIRKILDKEGKFVSDNITWHYVNTSEPHLVTFDEIDDDELVRIGNSFNQDSDIYPIGINLNRVSKVNESTINVLTFERGINRLTKACGSGSASCVALSKRLGFIDPTMNKVTVKVRGGHVVVSNEDGKIYLSGPCSVDGIDNIEDINSVIDI